MRRREKTDGNKETDMEGEAGAKQLRERLLNAQKILVGIGMEWDPKTPERKAKITTAAETLRRLLSGRDYYVITSLEEEGALALGTYGGTLLRILYGGGLEKLYGLVSRYAEPEPGAFRAGGGF